MLAPATVWKLTNHHKTYLSVQCDIWCNCCSSVPIISLPNDSLSLGSDVDQHFCVGLALECFC